MREKNDNRLYTVHGRKYSKEEIEQLLEKWIPKRDCVLPEYFEEAEKPTYGKVFKVDLATINVSLFLKERDDSEQESLRKTILQAISEALLNQEEYGSFYYLIPRREWVFKNANHMTVEELVDFSEKQNGWLGDRKTEILAYAQQISNSDGLNEDWMEICNRRNNPELCRLDLDKNGEPIFVRCATEVEEEHETEKNKLIMIGIASHHVFYRLNKDRGEFLPAVIIKSLHCLTY